ncbi:DUF4858 domain-containing protein [Tannerella sp.]|uniref:DUF4858 domain-containing protein n=1 Tax=Tannerella sp. TaxID=2382127 RepID=UPI0026DCFEAA|nr:DUF4858 domain-containing protein [Tannerella sp.]MDO4704300.1 DUF4858 domain-containing protein [Tannerella sp.]
MEKRCVLFLILGLQVCIAASAQKDWSAKDSLWLQRVLSGQEKLKLNEETLRAIRSGTLINPAPAQQMKHSPLELPIVKSFDSIIRPESHRKLHLLPPSVFMLYDLNKNNKSANDPDRATNKSGGMMLSERQIEEMKILMKMNVKKTTVDDQRTLPSPYITFSAEDIARSIFWPSHRAKKRNARNAQAYKQFEVAPPSISKEEHERRRLNEYINRLREYAKKRLLSDSVPHQPDSVDIDFRIRKSR